MNPGTNPVQDQKKSAMLVRETIQTPGWTLVLEPELTADCERLMRLLVAEEDGGKVREYQMELRALQKLLAKIAGYVAVSG